MLSDKQPFRLGMSVEYPESWYFLVVIARNLTRIKPIIYSIIDGYILNTAGMLVISAE